VADEEPRAASRIGYLYLWRDEENQDFAAAARWFMKAAEQGVAEAQLHLGVMLLNGYGVEENPRRAFKWVKEAADQGLAGANRELGMMYVEGKGVDMDRDIGMRYLATAASMGDKSAKQWLSENCLKKPQWLIDMTEQTKTSE
jgi:TPR repeat protein